MVMHFGKTLTYLGMSGASLAGMVKLTDNNVVNTITFTDEGLVKINVSTGPFTSQDITAPLSHMQGVIGLGNTDPLNGDLDRNIIQVDSYELNGQTVQGPTHFLLPDESYKNVAMLDWIMSKKEDEDQLAESFNNCLMSEFDTLTEISKSLGQLAPLLAHSGIEVRGRSSM